MCSSRIYRWDLHGRDTSLLLLWFFPLVFHLIWFMNFVEHGVRHAWTYLFKTMWCYVIDLFSMSIIGYVLHILASYFSYAYLVKLARFVKYKGCSSHMNMVCFAFKRKLQIMHTFRGSPLVFCKSFVAKHCVVIKHQKGGDWKDISIPICFDVCWQHN